MTCRTNPPPHVPRPPAPRSPPPPAPLRIHILPEPSDEPLPRRTLRCQCDGEPVGPCPGPLNCPYSGENE